MDIQLETANFEISSTSEFTITNVNNGLVIGELHQRENPSQKEKERFDQLLEENKDSTFILESNPSKSDLFTNTQSPKSFMEKALQFAQENRNQMEIMDDERITKDRYGIWKEVGTDFSQRDFDTLNSIYMMRNGIQLHNQSFEQVVSNIQNSEILDEGRKQTYLNEFSKYIRILQSEERDSKLASIDKLVTSFFEYDAICRERYYQGKVAKIKEEKPDKKIFAVFGKSHTQGISKTIQDPTYRTPLPSVAKTKWLMGNI